VTRSVYAQISNLIVQLVRIISALVLSCGPIAAPASSGFLNSCDDIQVGNKYTVTTKCQSVGPNLPRRPTGLDLNLCIANAHSTMAPHDLYVCILGPTEEVLLDSC
jgi:hypothetical protein